MSKTHLYVKNTFVCQKLICMSKTHLYVKKHICMSKTHLYVKNTFVCQKHINFVGQKHICMSKTHLYVKNSLFTHLTVHIPKTVQCILALNRNVHKMASFSVSEWCIRTVQRIISDLVQYDDGTQVNSSGEDPSSNISRKASSS